MQRSSLVYQKKNNQKTILEGKFRGIQLAIKITFLTVKALSGTSCLQKGRVCHLLMFSRESWMHLYGAGLGSTAGVEHVK